MLRRMLLIGSLAFGMPAKGISQSTAITPEGRQVALNSDGTWEYISVDRASDGVLFRDDKIEITEASLTIKPMGYKGSGGLGTSIFLPVTVISATEFVRPKTHRIWGYDDGSDIGGTSPDGFTLTDSFGNDLPITSVSPSYLRYNEKGLRLGSTETFTIVSNDYPLESASHVRLRISSSVFQTSKPIQIEFSAADFVRRN